MHPSNNYVGSCTRSFLDGEIGLCKEQFDLIETVLAHIRPTSPCGLIHGLSLGFGASLSRATDAAVAVELFYAACSLADDIQDGEAGYAGVDVAHRLNTQLMILCASFVALSKVSSVSSFGMGGIQMLQGQALEIAPNRPNTIDAYAKYSDGIAGAAFETYLGLVAVIVNDTWNICDLPFTILLRRYGRSMGNLIQIMTDQETKDPRWLDIHKSDRVEYSKTVYDRFITIADTVPKELDELTENILRRSTCTLFGENSGKST